MWNLRTIKLNMKLKYVLDETGAHMIFPGYVEHDTAARLMTSRTGCEIVGAGFIDLMDGEVVCTGHSQSLRKPSRGWEDAEMIANRLGLKNGMVK